MVDTQKKYIQIISDLVSIPKDELTDILKKDLRKKKATPLYLKRSCFLFEVYLSLCFTNCFI